MSEVIKVDIKSILVGASKSKCCYTGRLAEATIRGFPQVLLTQKKGQEPQEQGLCVGTSRDGCEVAEEVEHLGPRESVQRASQEYLMDKYSGTVLCPA